MEISSNLGGGGGEGHYSCKRTYNIYHTYDIRGIKKYSLWAIVIYDVAARSKLFSYRTIYGYMAMTNDACLYSVLSLVLKILQIYIIHYICKSECR